MLKKPVGRLLDRTVDRALEYQRAYLRRRALDLAMRRLATAESVDFLKARAPRARYFPTRFHLLSAALMKAKEPGLHIELGVRRGRTMRHIAKETSATIHGFDSFVGSPGSYAWPDIRGRRQDGKLPDVPANVTLWPGWFSDTLPRFIADHADKIAFLHVDCQTYESTKPAFDILGGRLVPGSVIVFDDYFNYWGWQTEEHRVFEEFLAASGYGADYFGVSEQQLAVKLLGPP